MGGVGSETGVFGVRCVGSLALYSLSRFACVLAVCVCVCVCWLCLCVGGGGGGGGACVRGLESLSLPPRLLDSELCLALQLPDVRTG